MKYREEQHTYIEYIYSCERCGYEVRFETRVYWSLAINCPKHGEFCYKCAHPKESKFPLMICPECNITWKEVIEHCGIGPGGGLIKPELLPNPFIIIKNDSSGYWIGSKK